MENSLVKRLRHSQPLNTLQQPGRPAEKFEELTASETDSTFRLCRRSLQDIGRVLTVEVVPFPGFTPQNTVPPSEAYMTFPKVGVRCVELRWQGSHAHPHPHPHSTHLSSAGHLDVAGNVTCL
ncbi:hypothetical protein E2C01_071272 [Portunus trituberculatus]|uniref:Uncharacterized protein n=1 Tax=Portunus trituberculatus TaxID=210409 RepID=A0A5B7I7J0_PORTR|nr:hypothetical protein [Portunus trituberculatus]